MTEVYDFERLAKWCESTRVLLATLSRHLDDDVVPASDVTEEIDPWFQGFGVGEGLVSSRAAFAFGCLHQYLQRLTEHTVLVRPLERAPSEDDPHDGMRRATTIFRTRRLVETFLGNLDRLSLPCATRIGQPLIGKPAIVAGAGWSLDQHYAQLRALRDRFTLITVNTATPALLKEGIQPDIVVCLEALPLAWQLDGLHPSAVLALDVSAHPSFFDLPNPKCWYSTAVQYAMPACFELRAPTITHAGSCGTAAVALALRWGADPVALVGMDLGYDLPEQQCYATGTPWQSLKVREEGDRCVFTECAERRKIHEENGIPLNSNDRALVRVENWNMTGHSYTTVDLLSQIEWLASVGRGWGKVKELYDCSEGGARKSPEKKDQWLDAPLSRVLRQLVPEGCAAEAMRRAIAAPHWFGEDTPHPETAIARAREYYRMEARAALDLASELAEPTGDLNRLGALFSGLPMVEALAAPALEMARAKQEKRGPARLAAALRDAASDVLEILNDA